MKRIIGIVVVLGVVAWVVSVRIPKPASSVDELGPYRQLFVDQSEAGTSGNDFGIVDKIVSPSKKRPTTLSDLIRFRVQVVSGDLCLR